MSARMLSIEIRTTLQSAGGAGGGGAGGGGAAADGAGDGISPPERCPAAAVETGDPSFEQPVVRPANGATSPVASRTMADRTVPRSIAPEMLRPAPRAQAFLTG